MSGNLDPTYIQPRGFKENDSKPDDGVTNDALGTVNPSDSTGVDDEKETGDARRNNKPTRED